jgi:hypothetical protein
VGEFGWAYISCDGDNEIAVGPTGSLQFHSGSRELSGSSELIYLPDTNTLNLTGTLNVSGTINANFMNIEVTNKNVINLSASGDTKFGDSANDTHQFSGSLDVSGGIKLRYYTQPSASGPSTYTVTNADYIIGISSSYYVGITLPSSSVAGSGRLFIIKDEWGGFATGSGGGRPSSALIAISASGTDKIDGNGNYEIKDGNNAAISLYANGSNGWFVF